MRCSVAGRQKTNGFSETVVLGIWIALAEAWTIIFTTMEIAQNEIQQLAIRSLKSQ